MLPLTRLHPTAIALSLNLLVAAGASCLPPSTDPPAGPGDDGPQDDGADDAPGDGADDAPADDDDGADGTDGADSSDGGDGQEPDASGPGIPDASGGPPDAAATPDAPVAPPFVEGPYEFLSESGLYSDIETHTVTPGIMAFEPEFKLWSDGAEKVRFIRLPPGGRINTVNMGRWGVPIGTTVWKEFTDPDTGKRLETRIIQRLSTGQFYFASFIWNEDDTEAAFDPTLNNEPPVDIPAGCSACPTPPCNSYPTNCHVVPQSGRCIECHAGEGSRLLGFSAVQLSHSGPGITLTDLVDLGLLTNPPAAGVTFPVPGTAVERRAIGTLHANCGHCHSSSYGQTGCFSLTQFQARVLPGDATPQDTLVFETAVDQPLFHWIGPMQGNHTAEQLGELITHRIVPGDAARSAIWYRMSVREFGQLPPNHDHQQMPYFATNEVDEEGLAAVEVWINSLP